MSSTIFLYAFLAAISMGPIGCCIIWKNLTSFTNALAHSAFMGAAIGLCFGINLAFSAFIVSSAVALLKLQKRTLDVLAYSSLAIGILAISLSKQRIDVYALLFGDFDNQSFNTII